MSATLILRRTSATSKPRKRALQEQPKTILQIRQPGHLKPQPKVFCEIACKRSGLLYSVHEINARERAKPNQKHTMKINQVGSNQTEVQQAGGVAVLYSYQTPVAAFVPGRGAVCDETKHSRTTSRHVSAAVARWGCSRSNVTAKEFAALIAA